MVRISMMMVRALVAAAERGGADRARLLVEAGLESAPLDDLQARISLDEYRRVVRAVYRLSGDPAFGLHMGERAGLGSFDVLGHLTEHGHCLREALDMVTRYSRIVSEGPRIDLEERGAAARLLLRLPEEDTPESRLASEFSMVAFLRVVRGFIDERALPQRVFFTHAKPAHAVEYTRIFGGREQFACQATGMELPRTWLDRVLPCREGELRSLLLTRAEYLLARATHDASARQRVERWLESQSDLARPTLERVARDLGTSARSLRRRLSEEQVQFSALLESARAAHARQLLLADRRSIQDAAYALGFRTPSAFSRAFKRWTGLSPKAYRAAR